ncbi:MAG: ankyrin repeat domain-containing protein [Xanthomonadales bacterium]|nr:ankyrin repeat domain-containing protein [Xanthomonadales bacterium]
MVEPAIPDRVPRASASIGVLAGASAAILLHSIAEPLPALLLSFACWSLALALLPAWSMPHLRLATAAGLVLAHGAVLAVLIFPALWWWWNAASLSAALAIALAIALAVVLAMPCWLAPALSEADGNGRSGVRAALARARSLTALDEALLWRGLLPMTMQVLALAAPILMASAAARASGWPVLLAIAATGLMLGFAAQRMQAGAATPAPGDAEQPPAAIPLPVPADPGERTWLLRQSLRAGEVDHALALLAAGADVLAPAWPDEPEQRCALIIAAGMNDSRPLRAMLAAGIDVNHAAQGMTPLLVATRASYYGRPETVLALIANGADAMARCPEGRTPLHHAALSVDPAVAATLLDAGTAIDASDDEGHTPLSLACSVGNAAVVRLLLERQASLAVPGALPALAAAAQAGEGDPRILGWLLQAKAPLAAADAQGWTALHHAAAAGNRLAAERLIDAGADVGARDQRGRTPLHLAWLASETDAALCELLLRAGADADVADDEGHTPRALQAARSPQPALPLEAGAADPGVELGEVLLADGQAAALTAWLARAGDPQRVRLALAAARLGARRALADALARPLSADAVDDLDQPALAAALADAEPSLALLRALPAAGVSVAGGAWLARLLACGVGPVEQLESVALAWLEAGADPFAPCEGASPLTLASAAGCERLLGVLLERGCDPRQADRAGSTPLHHALRQPDELALQMVCKLLAAGADPGQPDCAGETALAQAQAEGRTTLLPWLRWSDWRLPGRRLSGHDLVAAAAVGDLAAVRRLRALGIPAEGRDPQGCTPLIRAAGGGHAGVVAALLASGADLSSRSHSGMSPLSAAVVAGHEAVVTLLLEAGAAPEQRLAGEATALVVAAACGAVGSVRALLSAGASVIARDSNGNAPLHAAAGFAFGSRDASRVRALLLELLSAGATVDASNHAGLTPLHVACGAAAAAPPDSVGVEAALDVLLSRSSAHAMVDRKGCLPLHYAAANGLAGSVRRLVARGADAGQRDHGGWSALDYAVRYGHSDVVNDLQRAAGSYAAAPAVPLRPA